LAVGLLDRGGAGEKLMGIGLECPIEALDVPGDPLIPMPTLTFGSTAPIGLEVLLIDGMIWIGVFNS